MGIDSIDYVWYVRDAQGNALAHYSSKVHISDTAAFTGQQVRLTERTLYGSSRLGVERTNIIVHTSERFTGDSIYTALRGEKVYELSNHLGNVLVTLSDKKIGVSSGNSSLIDSYRADVLSAQSYYPFGMRMPGRSYGKGSGRYRYGFNGKENDNEVKGGIL